MELICAIDLLGGEARRLAQGDYDRPLAARRDAVGLARELVRQGAARLHLIDLEGARAGSPMQLSLLRRVAAAAREVSVEVHIQAGGGLRSVAAVESLFDADIDQAVLGSAALSTPGFLSDCAKRWPGRVLASLDLRGELLAVDGWTRSSRSGETAEEAADRLLDEGASGLVLTDVERDATLSGPNSELLGRFRTCYPRTWLAAAGGIASVEDLRALADLGVDGAIVGRAVLEGRLDLAKAQAGLARSAGRPA